MAEPLPPLPPGFQLVQPNGLPPLPPGFVLQPPNAGDAAAMGAAGMDAGGQPHPAGILANVGAGASRGIYGDILGAPVDAVNFGLKQVGLGSERPLGGSEDMRAVSDYIASIPSRVVNGNVFSGQSPRVEPTNEAERIAYAGGRAAGNAAGSVMGGSVLAAASQPGGMANAIGNALQGQPINQVISAATGGAVGEATDNPWIGLAAGIGTGAAIGLADNAVRGITAPFRDAGRQQIAGGTIARLSRENADDLARTIQTRGPDLVPGSQRTTAEVTRNAGVANLERSMRNDPNAVARFNNLDQTRIAARDAQVARLGPGMDAPAAGGVLRNSFDDAYGAARQTTNRAYDVVRNSQAAIDPQDAYTAGAQSMQRYFGPGAGDPPPELAQMLGDLRSGNVSLPMLERIMQRASAFARQSTDPRAQSVARDIRTAIGESMQTAARNGAMPADDAAAVIAARAARADQGQVFENQFTGRLSGRTPRGSTTMPIQDSEIPSQFFGTGRATPERLRALTRAIGDDPQAIDALRQFGINDFRRAAYNARGDLQVEAARKWMRDHHASLNAVPGLRDTLNRTIRPVLADADSARFARDAGRAAGSNTVQNAMTATAMDRITGVPLSGIPGAESLYSATIGRASRLLGTEEAMREAMLQALIDPDYAAMALRMSQEAGYNTVPLLRALTLPAPGVGAYGVRDAVDGPNSAPYIRVTR